MTQEKIHHIGSTYNVNEWLTVPKTEVILRTPDNAKIKASELQGIVNRLAINKPEAQVEYWLKIHP